MSEDCPILGRLIHEYKNGQVVGAMFYDVNGTLDGFRDTDRTTNSHKVQLMRAFYCLDVIRWKLVGQVVFSGEPSGRPVPRTREGLQALIEEAERMEKSCVVEGMTTAFSITNATAEPDAELTKRRLEEDATGALLVVEACEFLRPRMRNGKSLERMGYYLYLAIKRQSSETLVKHARNLSNITEEHAIVWTP